MYIIIRIIMELQMFKAMWEYLSSNSHPTKSFQALTRIKQVNYHNRKAPGKQGKDNSKIKCIICNGAKYEHVLMLIIHIQILHEGIVEKYSISGDTVTIVQSNKTVINEIGHGYIQPLKNSSGGIRTFQQPFFIKSKMQSRVSDMLCQIANKLERALHKKEQVYLHSTDIFRQISDDQLAEDSQDELGEVEKELEKLRIQDFGDVNANDKNFFIEWNGFIHEKRRQMEIIFSFQIPKLFVEFCGMIRRQNKGIPRINLVMHAWTLWSSGQINSNDVISGLAQFDRKQE